MTQMSEWFHELINRLEKVPVLSDMEKAHEMLHSANRILFIGNGGSAAIASHMSVDYSKNGGVPAIAFNDPMALTCFANDYGFEDVFAKQIAIATKPWDVLVAISSSGRSANIINGVIEAQKHHLQVITLSGFDEDNPLRTMGNINMYVPSHDFGVVEVTHLSILHAMVKP